MGRADAIDRFGGGGQRFEEGGGREVEDAEGVVGERPDQLHPFGQDGRLAGPLDALAQPLGRHLGGLDEQHGVGATVDGGLVLRRLRGLADARSVVDGDVRHGF